MTDDVIKWWGYKHVNGSFHAKRFFDDKDLQEARESDFVEQVFEPIEGTKENILIKMKGVPG